MINRDDVQGYAAKTVFEVHIFLNFFLLLVWVFIYFETICCFAQALQAPACHENMVKVAGYILGEFGNLIAGDQRSRY